MDNKIDCKGLACPKPVITTKKKLEEMDKGSLTIVVDNEAAKGNLSKLAKSMGYGFSTKDISKDEYEVIINKDEDATIEEDISDLKNLKDEALVFSNDKMGKGDDELGKILMRSFVYTVSETLPYPKKMIFYNGGVRLTCEDSEVLDELILLEKEGVEIISCGTCLDFLGIDDKLKVGSVSNMYTIYEEIRGSKSNINIG